MVTDQFIYVGENTKFGGVRQIPYSLPRTNPGKH